MDYPGNLDFTVVKKRRRISRVETRQVVVVVAVAVVVLIDYEQLATQQNILRE